jgi:tRNA (pseudouridine54-N1)-methyltransferase
MNLVFFIKSATVDIRRYTIKDIPGSSGRLDVISRCILSALTIDTNLEENIQIWVFLDKYGTFVFDSVLFNDESFPKNEILLTDFFVEFIKKTKKGEKYPETPLDSIKYSKLDVFDAIKNFVEKKYKVFALNENGKDFKEVFEELSSKDNLLFILGDQSGDLLNDNELKKLNLVDISLGNRSYLASSTIRLIKMNLQLLI